MKTLLIIATSLILFSCQDNGNNIMSTPPPNDNDYHLIIYYAGECNICDVTVANKTGINGVDEILSQSLKPGESYDYVISKSSITEGHKKNKVLKLIYRCPNGIPLSDAALFEFSHWLEFNENKIDTFFVPCAWNIE